MITGIGLFIVLILCIIVISLVGYFLRDLLRGKSGVEMILLAILIFMAGFAVYSYSTDFYSSLLISIGIILMILGFLIGILSFLLKRI